MVAELPDLERLIRREAVPTASSVVVESVPATAREGLRSLVLIKQNRSMEEADAAIRSVPFTLAEAMTRGEAQELVEQLFTRWDRSEDRLADDPSCRSRPGRSFAFSHFVTSGRRDQHVVVDSLDRAEDRPAAADEQVHIHPRLARQERQAAPAPRSK